MKLVSGVFWCFLLFSCNPLDAQSHTFLYLGHTYDWSNPTGNSIDSRILNLDLSSYDGFWFGGDICANTSLDPKTWQYLDTQFNLKHPWTHVSLGNHDYRDDNLHLYYHTTQKSDFYTSNIHSLVISVLNTNLNASDCQTLDNQFDMLMSVTDTIQEASHYLLLMHHQIFKSIPGLSDFKSNGICDNYQLTCQGTSHSFEDRLYPKLIELEKKGIDVLLLVGDSGWHKGGEWECDHGITFIASGINNSYYKANEPERLGEIKKDILLEFTYAVDKKELNWRFFELGDF